MFPKFATAINCMDGRCQLPVIEWMKKRYGVEYVDMITEPGPDGILAERKDNTLLDSIKKRIQISVEKHASKVIAVVGHHDCAGNPVDRETHLKHIREAAAWIRTFAKEKNYEVEVVGLYVNENWEVEEVE